MKTIIFCIHVFLCCTTAKAQQVTVNYSSLLKKTPFTISMTDTGLSIQNVVPNKGEAIRLEVNGNKVSGVVSKGANSETVNFNLANIFKGKKALKGKLFTSETEFAGYELVGTGPAPFGQLGDGAQLTFTGIAYWDALSVFKYIQSPGFNEDSLTGFINNYSKVKYTSIAACKSNNEFISLALDQFDPNKNSHPVSDNMKNEAIDLQSTAAMGILGSLSGLDVTQYVQAFADFLRDRIKEELTIAYINEFRNKIRNVKEFEYMLPKTINVFNTGDIFTVPTMGAAYKSAFAEDMANLPENFERMVFTYDKYKDYRNREDFILFMAAYYSIKMSAEKYHPSDILRFIDSKYGYKLADSSAAKVRVGLSLLNVLSKNLTNVEDGTWIDKSKVSVLNPFVINTFLGLVYEQNRELLDAGFQVQGVQKKLRDLLKQQPVERIFQFVTLANNIEERIREYKDMVKERVSDEDRRRAVMAYFISNADDFFNLFDFGGNIVSNYSNNPEFYHYKEVVKNTIAVAKGVKTNNMAQVGVNIIALIKQITGMNNEDTTIQQLTHYINFITDMVYADSSAQIREVLQTYAAPPRSYRAIRRSSHSVSLASFPGVYVGYETHSPSAVQKKGNGVFGITAPIGVSVGWGNSHKESNSLALFLSVVDIGAALTYRWSNDSADLPQKVSLGQIFSPGIFGVYGFKNSPLALKVGTQYIPQLRSIKQGSSITEANAWHFSASLCVDIPILIFSQGR